MAIAEDVVLALRLPMRRQWACMLAELRWLSICSPTGFVTRMDWIARFPNTDRTWDRLISKMRKRCIPHDEEMIPLENIQATLHVRPRYDCWEIDALVGIPRRKHCRSAQTRRARA